MRIEERLLLTEPRQGDVDVRHVVLPDAPADKRAGFGCEPELVPERLEPDVLWRDACGRALGSLKFQRDACGHAELRNKLRIRLPIAGLLAVREDSVNAIR